MKPVTKAEFNRRLAAVERERLRPRYVRGAGEFVGGGGVAPIGTSFWYHTSTSSPASLTDLGISTTRWPRPRRGDSTYFARGWGSGL